MESYSCGLCRLAYSARHHVDVAGRISSSCIFLSEWNSLFVPCFVYLCIRGSVFWLSHCLAVRMRLLWIFMCKLFWGCVRSSWVYTRSGISGSCGHFNFLRNCSLFHKSGCTIVHSHQPSTSSVSTFLLLWIMLLGTLVYVFSFFFLGGQTWACGSSQARGRNGATASGLHPNHSNSGSEPHLGPTPQLMAMLDP